MSDEKLRCDYCGKFIALDDFSSDKADRKLLSVDSAISNEDYETYHKICYERDKLNNAALMAGIGSIGTYTD